MTSSDLYGLIAREAITVPLRFNKDALHPIGDHPERYEYIGTLEEAYVMFPGLHPHERERSDRQEALSTLEQLFEQGMRLMIVPYTDKKHAYVLGEKRVIN